MLAFFCNTEIASSNNNLVMHSYIIHSQISISHILTSSLLPINDGISGLITGVILPILQTNIMIIPNLSHTDISIQVASHDQKYLTIYSGSQSYKKVPAITYKLQSRSSAFLTYKLNN